MKTIPLGPFLGVNNRRPSFDLHVDKVGDFLASGDNIDIDNAGNILRRRANVLIAGTPEDSHSLHMTGTTAGYLVISSSMYAVTLPSYTQTLFKVLTSNDPVTWVPIGDDLYYSNGTDKGRITGGVWYPLGLPTPAAPTLSTIGGALLKANYQVSVAYCNTATGEEGGISPAATTELTATGGIRVTLPASTPGATHINVYLSNANGEVCYWLAQVVVGTTSYDCIALPTGAQAQKRDEHPLPAGKLFTSNGRLCSIVGSRVYVGMPHKYGYFLWTDADHLTAGYIDFNFPVSIAVENQGGTYICADVTRWFPGDLGDVQGNVVDVLPYGAVSGSVFHVPDTPLVGWFGAMGIVLADTQGGAKCAMADNIDQTPPESGTATVFQSGGYMRVASCGWCMNLENGAVTPYSDWGFTSISGGYGTKEDGIYTMDADGPVDAVAGLGKLNFGTEAKKYLPAVYAGVACEEPMQLRVQAPGDVDYTYEANGCSEDLQIQRIDPGKGLEANWFELSLLNQDGADFTLASVSFAPAATSRRV